MTIMNNTNPLTQFQSVNYMKKCHGSDDEYVEKHNLIESSKTSFNSILTRFCERLS